LEWLVKSRWDCLDKIVVGKGLVKAYVGVTLRTNTSRNEFKGSLVQWVNNCSKIKTKRRS
jgi:hypothetical protein